MTTAPGAAPTNQPCPACRALVYYEGHSELRGTLVPHRFHCHACGRAYIVRSTSHKPPRFALSLRHAIEEEIEHDHDEEMAAAVASAATMEAPAQKAAPATPAAGTEAAQPSEPESPRQG